MKQKLPIAVLVSGSGSNLQAIIDSIEAGRLSAEVRVVISNQEDAPALERCRKHHIKSAVISRSKFPDPQSFEEAIKHQINSSGARLVCLAGFMKILSQDFVEAFEGRLINIHPALLPDFPGLHAQKQALEAGVKEAGCSVHFVDEGVDAGPIILQAKVPVLPNDTEETLSKRILAEEHKIYPKVIQMFAEGKLRV